MRNQLLRSFFIMFSVPETIKAKLPFNAHSMITNVTYKVVCVGYYLVSTVIYEPDVKNHLVIFQAIIKKVDINQFSVYFEALFKFFDIFPETSQLLFSKLVKYLKPKSLLQVFPVLSEIICLAERTSLVTNLKKR